METLTHANQLSPPRFVRRTALNANEYRKNFKQIDVEVISALTCDEASRVTPLMSKIYLSLINAPSDCWERGGVLRFTGKEGEGKWLTAWQQLVELTAVSSATASKAIGWMHEQGIIGYHARRNGIGIRIFINRAASSIGITAPGSKKFFPISHASTEGLHTSSTITPFKESFAYSDKVLDSESNPCAPKNGAWGKRSGDQESSLASCGRSAASASRTLNRFTLRPEETAATGPTTSEAQRLGNSDISSAGQINLREVVEQVAKRLEPRLTETCAREYARIRHWFGQNALPKAVRVGQREAYDVLRSYGLINGSRTARGRASCSDAGARVGQHIGGHNPPKKLSPEEIDQFASACMAMLFAQGQSIDHTLSEMSVEAGGFMLPDDVESVREKANSLLLSHRGEGSDDNS